MGGPIAGVARFWAVGTALTAMSLATFALDVAKRLRPPPPTCRTVLHEGDWTDGT